MRADFQLSVPQQILGLCGCVVLVRFYVAGTNDVVRYVPVMSNMDDLDAPIIYQEH